MNVPTGQIIHRITEYLSLGGLFNPEMMEHDKVRDLLIDCRDTLSPAGAQSSTEGATSNQ